MNRSRGRSPWTDPPSIDREAVLDGLERDLGRNDVRFFDRVYDGGLSLYRHRLDQIGFLDSGRVLDAGCGFGQWSIALAESNHHVVGTDASEPRVSVCDRIADQYAVENVSFLPSHLESLPFRDGRFDAVFSYSVVYLLDFAAAAAEFHRVLKPGGPLYLCTNGLGKYLYDIVHRPNPAADFDPRRFGLKSIRNTLLGRTDSLSRQEGGRFMTERGTVRKLRNAGFRDVRVAGEGCLAADGRDPNPDHRIYEGTYLGFRKVFETMATKPVDDQ